MTRNLIYLAASAMGLALVGTWSHAQDRIDIVPEMKVLLDNDCVHVQYHDVAVGQTIPMHSHPKYVVYTLKPLEARITLPDPYLERLLLNPRLQRTALRAAAEPPMR